MADSSPATLISWTPANWLTVVLMVGIAYTVVAAVARTMQQRKAAAA